MNKTYLIFVFLFFWLQGFTDNIMILPNEEVEALSVETIEIKINNDDPFVGFQLDVEFQNQLTYVTSSVQLNPNRATDHIINATLIQPLILRIFAYSITNSPFIGDTGTIATVQFISGVVPGLYPLNINNPIIGNINSQNIITNYVEGSLNLLAPDFYANAEILNYGQVPLGTQPDKSFNISNLGNQVLQITQITTNSPYFTIIGLTAFDILPGQLQTVIVRFNSVVKGAYNNMISIVTNDPDEGSISISLNAVAFAVNEVHVGNISSFSQENHTLSFSINNMEPFVGFQFDLNYQPQMNYIPGSISLSNRKTDHIIDANILPNNILRIIAFSPTNQFFTGAEGIICSIELYIEGVSGTYTLAINQVIIGNELGQNILSAHYNGVLTINAADISCYNQIDYGQVSILDTIQKSLTISNVGVDTLLLDQVLFTDAQFSLITSLPLSLLPNTQQNIVFSFSPIEESEFTEEMRIYSNDPDENPFTVTLTGFVNIPNTMFLEDIYSNYNDTVSLQVFVDNYEPFVGFQFDLIFPNIMTCYLDSITLTNRAQGHILTKSLINPTTVRIIAFSFQQLPFLGNSGPIVSFVFDVETDHEETYPLILANAILANAQSQNILYATQNGNLIVTPGIQPPQIFIDPDSLQFTLQGINATDTKPLTITNNGLGALNWEIDTTTTNYALYFDGIDDYVDLGNPSLFNFLSTDSISVNLWVHPENISGIATQRFFDKYSESQGLGYSFGLFGLQGKIELYMRGGYGSGGILHVVTANSISNDNWYNVSVTYNGSKLASGVHIYINGVDQQLLVNSNNLNTNSFQNSVNAQIAAMNGINYPFQGVIEEVSLWKKVLSQGQIDSIINNFVSTTSEGLVGYWTFNEDAGFTTEDFSINNNIGTLVGDPGWILSEINPPGSLQNILNLFDFSSVTGILNPGQSTVIDVTVSSDSLALGSYNVNLIINNNDPANSQLSVPCTLNILEPPEINLHINVFLEGPFNQSLLNTFLNSDGLIPLSQPYSGTPWNYGGSESVTIIPNSDIVDWILVELRETSGDASTAISDSIIGRRAGFIKSNGTIVDLDGASNIVLPIVALHNLYTVINHRNHLGIMSALPLVKTNGVYNYDYSIGSSQVYGGTEGTKQLVSGIWGMIAGDANADMQINVDDKNIWENHAGYAGYFFEDFNLNGQVNNNDKLDLWFPNLGRSSQMPIDPINLPPNPPSNPIPTDAANNQPINSTLSWFCDDPNNDPLTYDVYFGSTNPPPIVSSDQTNRTFTPGQLNYNTLYYWQIIAKDNHSNITSGSIWSFATLQAPFQCGDIMIDNRDAQTYNTVQIGTQCWMANNLNVGTMITGTTESTNNSQIEKYCYSNITSNCDIYGGLYQWNEMMQYSTVQGVMGVCPIDWHIPAESEWILLFNFLGGDSVAGGKMKEVGLIHWASPNYEATNFSGFTALPGGYRGVGGDFGNLTFDALFWTSTEITSTHAVVHGLASGFKNVSTSYSQKAFGFSIRCIKD